MNPRLTELSIRLRSGDDTAVRDALIELEEFLLVRSPDRAFGSPADDDLVFARHQLMAFIDVDPERPAASTAVWVLGKLYDQSLESYFTNLAIRFGQRDTLSGHLYQTIVALDNLDAFPPSALRDFQQSERDKDIPAMRRLIQAYINAGGPDRGC